jgi:hypothetical protein
MYLHAFTLNDDFSHDNVPERWIGPFDNFGITYEVVRLYKDDDPDWEDDQFTYNNDTGFWYPITRVRLPNTLGSTSGYWDPIRGRYSDLEVHLDIPQDIRAIAQETAVITIEWCERESIASAQDEEREWATGHNFEDQVQRPQSPSPLHW